MPSGLWDLDDDAEQLTAAAESWSRLSSGLSAAADDVAHGARTVLESGWESESATSYDAHRKELAASMDDAAEVAANIASTVADASGSVHVAQGHLDREWARVVHIPHEPGPYFHPRDKREERQVNQSIAAARDIRNHLQAQLTRELESMRGDTATFKEVARTWEPVSAGRVDPFELPEADDDTGVITRGDETVINTGDGNDDVDMWGDPATGEQLVIVNGRILRFPPGQRITVRTGDGHDTVRVRTGRPNDYTLLTGDGEDTVEAGEGSDTVVSGEGSDQVESDDGDDYVSSGADRDYVDGQDGEDSLHGGEGDDTLYGLDGADTISGGEGDDYLEGGDGDDVVVGGSGNDVGSGGDGDDQIIGGSGDDVTYAGRGEDTTYGGAGDDTAHSEAGDTDQHVEDVVPVDIEGVPDFIQIDGSPEFQERLRADLGTLASSPRGQLMLENLQRNYEDSGVFGLGKDGLTITQLDENNGRAFENDDGSAGVRYNPSFDSLGRGAPPVVVLYHELAHVYDYVNETYDGDLYRGDDTVDADNNGDSNPDNDIKNAERQASGLPIDHDGDPSTPEIVDPDHPFAYTENGLRDELGLDDREHYARDE